MDFRALNGSQCCKIQAQIGCVELMFILSLIYKFGVRLFDLLLLIKCHYAIWDHVINDVEINFKIKTLREKEEMFRTEEG